MSRSPSPAVKQRHPRHASSLTMTIFLLLALAGLVACGPTASFRRGGGGGGGGGTGNNVGPCAPPAPVTTSPSTAKGIGTSAASTFMDLHVGSSDLLSTVSIPYGSLRLWDTLTGWAQINSASGVYDFSMLDGFVNSSPS